MNKGLKPEEPPSLMEKQDLPDRLRNRLAINPSTEPCKMEEVMLQVIDEARFTDYKYNYRYKILGKIKEEDRPRRGEIIRLIEWKYDPRTTDFLVERYQRLGNGGNIPTFPERQAWRVDDIVQHRKDSQFKVIVAPSKPFQNLNHHPLDTQSIERLLHGEPEERRQKFVDLTLEDD